MIWSRVFSSSGVRSAVEILPPTSRAITRQVVFELAEGMGVACREQSLTAYDLYTADECFLTGTGAELIPVAEVQGRRIGHGERAIFERLQFAFRELIAAEVASESSRELSRSLPLS